MADYVASQTISLDDQLSAGATAAAATLDKLADSADKAAASTDNAAASVTKAGPSAASLARQCDPATKALQDLAVAQANLAQRTATMAAAVASGNATQAQANSVTDVYAAKLRAAQVAVDQLTASNATGAKAAAGLTEANTEAGAAATAAAGGHAGLYREILVLGHEVISGNYSRIPGSMMVLAERSGQLENIFSAVGAAFTTASGLMIVGAAAGVVALGALAYSTNNYQQQVLDLQSSIRLTKDNYVELAVEAENAARIAAQATPGLSSSDAVKVTSIIQSSPQFTGTQEQLAALTELAANMGAAFKETAEKAATDLAAAMDNPGQAAERLVGHLKGMTQALADSIAQMQAGGDKAGAFAELEQVLSDRTAGVAENLTPLGQALRDLETAFTGTSTASGGFVHGLGVGAVGAIVSVAEAVAHLVQGLNLLYSTAAHIASLGNGNDGVNVTSPADVASAITNVGASIGAPAAVIAMAQRIAPMESSTGQFDSGGNVVTSSAGALGAMGVMPMNAGKNDLNTLAGNVTAGEQLLVSLYQKYHGNQYLVAMAYNWGENNVDNLLNGTGSAAPQSVADYAAKAAPVSAGNGVSNTDTGVLNQALAASSGSAESQAEALTAKIALLKEGLQELTDQGADPNGAAFGKLTTELNAATLAYSNLAEPTFKVAQQIDTQTKAQASLANAYTQGYTAVARATAANAAYGEAVTTVGTKSDEFGAVVDVLTQKNLALANATGQVAVAQDAMQLGTQIAAQEHLSAAYSKGYDAVEEATAQNAAYGEAVTKVGGNAAALSAALAFLTQKHIALADATAKTAVAQQTLANGDTLAYLQAETASVSMDSTARDEMLAHLKAEQELREKNVSGLSTEGQAYLASVDAISEQTAALAKSQQVMSDLENIASSSFDSISSAITNAFAQGGKSVVDFGSIARTVLSQVVSDVAKIGVLNPILNILFGGNRTTLSDVQGLLGGADSGSASGTVQLGGVSLDGGLNPSIGTATVPATQTRLGGFLSTSTIGTGTIGSTLGGIGAGFGAGNTLNSLIGGNSTGGEVGSAVGAAAGAAIGSIIPGIGTLIGGLIGGAGGGLLGGLFGNSKPSDDTMKAQENLVTGATATLGESSGAEYSAANLSAAQNLASVTQTAAASLASAFNLTVPNVNVNAKIGNRDGDTLRIGGGTTYSSTDNTASSAASLVNQAINGLVGKIGGSLDTTTKTILQHIDYSSSSATTEVSNLAAALTNGKLDATQTAALPKLSTSDATDTITELGWIKNTYEPTVNSSSDMGSTATQIAAVNASFTDLIAHAQRLGLATDALTTAQAAQVATINQAQWSAVAASRATITAASQAENGDKLGSSLTTFDANAQQQLDGLVTEFKGMFGDTYASQGDFVKQTALLTATIAQQRSDLIAAANLAAMTTTHTTDAAWVSNITAGWKAQATIAGLQGTPAGNAQAAAENEDADLANFDAQSKTAIDAYSAQLTAAYGSSYTTTSYYAQQMVDLESSLAEQRLAIQAQYAAQAKAAQTSAESSAASVVTSLANYVESLQTGTSSPLNPQSQYALAKSQYQAVAGSAAAGNVASLGEIQSYATAFLTASENVNGSGAGYANDYSAVLANLQAIASIPQNTLTASFMAAALQDQTDTLATILTGLRSDVQSVQVELKQQNARAA